MSGRVTRTEPLGGFTESFCITAILNYETLQQRVCEVASIVHEEHISVDEIDSLSFDCYGDGKSVCLTYPGRYESECVVFPRSYLWTPNDLVWRIEDNRRAEEEAHKRAGREHADREDAIRKEAEERALYENLKAKFEPKGA